METDKEKLTYLNQRPLFYQEAKYTHQLEYSHKNMKDSLYQKLMQTPSQETQEKINSSSVNQKINKTKQSASVLANDQQKYVKNLTDKFDQATNLGLKIKQNNIKQKIQIKTTHKITKPSTPTYHAQSSLNFLKHRKKQILMNQAMGVTLNKVQQLKRSRSKSKESNKSIKNLNQKGYLQQDQYKQIKAYNNYDKRSKDSSSLKKNHFKSKSISQLQKIENLIEDFHQKKSSNGKRNFLQRSRMSQINNQFSKSNNNSLANSLNSLSSSSNQSVYSNDSDKPSKSRAQILSKITQKLTQSRVLKKVQVTKQKKDTKQIESKQSTLSKRLQKLEYILKEIQIKKNQKNEVKSKSIRNFDIMNRLKQQIDGLNEQLNELNKGRLSNKNKVQKRIVNDLQSRKLNKPVLSLQKNTHLLSLQKLIPTQRFNPTINQLAANNNNNNLKIKFNYSNASGNQPQSDRINNNNMKQPIGNNHSSSSHIKYIQPNKPAQNTRIYSPLKNHIQKDNYSTNLTHRQQNINQQINSPYFNQNYSHNFYQSYHQNQVRNYIPNQPQTYRSNYTYQNFP